MPTIESIHGLRFYQSGYVYWYVPKSELQVIENTGMFLGRLVGIAPAIATESQLFSAFTFPPFAQTPRLTPYWVRQGTTPVEKTILGIHHDPDTMRAYKRDWVRRRRAEWIQANGPCRFCRSWDRLEVDHVDPSLKVTHSVWTWARPRRDAELGKCRVLCHDCHVARHAAPHGRHRYNKLGCRCEVCRTANTLATRLVRQRCKELTGRTRRPKTDFPALTGAAA